MSGEFNRPYLQKIFWIQQCLEDLPSLLQLVLLGQCIFTLLPASYSTLQGWTQCLCNIWLLLGKHRHLVWITHKPLLKIFCLLGSFCIVDNKHLMRGLFMLPLLLVDQCQCSTNQMQTRGVIGILHAYAIYTWIVDECSWFTVIYCFIVHVNLVRRQIYLILLWR